MRLIHFCLCNLAGQLSQSNYSIIIYLRRQSFDHTSLLQFSLNLKSIQKELLSGLEDHALTKITQIFVKSNFISTGSL